ncbi:MAG: hypothetical protein ACREQI_11130 [Candidatus Binataceae bacterium]
MQSEVHAARNATAARVTQCLWCRRPVAYVESLRQHGFCRVCLEQDPEVGWRLIYDRDRNVGSIPVNLRAAYRL